MEDRLKTDDDIDFPNYDSIQLSRHDLEDEASRRSGEEDNDAPEISTTTDTTQSDSPLPTPTVADDTAIEEEPSRHVDYLTHDWRQEDIWASWRHIVSHRNVYGPRSRLENASWRTWAKSKYQLRTISPEQLNWHVLLSGPPLLDHILTMPSRFKESDVTWLYGPLKPAQSHPITSDTSTPPSQMSKSSSFINKKPILKKRSVSEVMLQKSLSASSLLKQAAASVQAQQNKSPRRGLNRVSSDFVYSSSMAPSQPPSREEVDYFSRRTSNAGVETPSDGKEKHIRFDEVVEQCVAVDCKEPEFDDETEPEVEDDPPNSALSDSSSDEGLVMLNKKRSGVKEGAQKGKISRSNSSSGKMIESIPATTLRNDSPDVTAEAQQHHVFGKNWNAGKLSPSPSQETLRPSRPSRNFLLADDDGEEEDDENSNSWSFGASNPKSSLGASANAEPSSSRARGEGLDSSEGFERLEGMRRTESGMFMPIDEDEDDMVAAGLFGRVSETVNTVRDIGWVLWNVGWRK